IVVECRDLGLKKVWMQPGSESERAISFCVQNDIKVVHDVCVMVKRREKGIGNRLKTQINATLFLF
ncbi:MAG: CoA-binding protein, partial [Euryarchaeota archaeon]|nr:CoA-binding protein [Euryarchaeota archaeon]